MYIQGDLRGLTKKLGQRSFRLKNPVFTICTYNALIKYTCTRIVVFTCYVRYCLVILTSYGLELVMDWIRWYGLELKFLKQFLNSLIAISGLPYLYKVKGNQNLTELRKIAFWATSHFSLTTRLD